MKAIWTTWLWCGMALVALTGCNGGGGSGDSGNAGNDANVSVVNRGTLFKYPVATAAEADGQLVVVDADLGAVLRVDPVSGNRMVISDAGMGSGPLFIEPVDIKVLSDGQLVVVDADLAAVLRVDPVSGDRAVISGASTGSGPLLMEPVNIAVEADGHLVVADPTLQAVVRIDPESGDRSIVTGCLEAPVSRFRPRSCPSGVMGNGPLFEVIGCLQYVAVEPDGNLLISGWDLALLRVDPVSGDRAILTGCSGVAFPNGSPECLGLVGDGPLAPTIGPVVVEADGHIVAADWYFIMVFRIDPLTGDRTIVTDPSLGGGWSFPWFYSDLTIEADGNLILTGADDVNETEDDFELLFPTILRIDSVHGYRTVVSGGKRADANSLASDASPPVDDPPPPVDNPPPPANDPPPPADNLPTPDDSGDSESGFRTQPPGLRTFIQTD